MATRRLKAIVEADDRASPTFRKIGVAVGALGAAAAAVGAVQIGRQLVGALGRAVQVAAEYEGATTRLAVALRNQGRLTEETRDELVSFARAQSLVSTATENQILSAVAAATAMGASTEAAQALTAAATDLAVATGVELETAFRQVNRTLGGYAGELGETIPELKELTAEQLKAGDAAAIIAEKFGGAGAAAAETFEGSLNNLNSELSRLQRGIGAPFRDVLTEAAQAFTPVISDLAEATLNSDLFRDSIVKSAIGITAFGQAIEGVVGSRAFQFLAAVAFVQIARTVSSTAGALKLFQDQLDGLQGGLLFDKDAAAGGFFAGLREELEKLLSTNTEGGLITDDDVEDTTAKVEVVKGDLLSLQEAVAESIEFGVAGTQARLLEADKGIRSLGSTIQSTLRGAGINAALSFGDALVDAAFTGKQSFEELFRSLLRDLARAIAQALILRAILGATGFGGFFAAGGIVGSQSGLNAALGAGFLGVTPIGAASGLLVPGFDTGRDSVLIGARPGEAVLPVELTNFLLEAASGGGSGGPVEITLRTDLPATVERINSGVRSGEVRVTATDLAGPRSVR